MAGPLVQLTPQVRTDAPESNDPAVVAVLKGPLPPFPPAPSAASTLTSIPASTSPVTLLAANANRLGFSIQNSSTTDTLFIKASASGAPVSTAFYTVAIYPQSYYEDPFHYVGPVTGIWTGTDGTALVDEYA